MKIVLQAGHVSPREGGFEAQTGTYKEQEFAWLVQQKLAALLRQDGRLTVVTCGGRTPDPRPYVCDLFISLHGDGSGNPAASGYCYGYPDSRGGAFSKKLKAEYEKIPGHPPHRTDNYTRALAGYYGFSTRRFTSPVRVLVEHGFLTNPSERAWLFGNADAIAAAHAKAILSVVPKPPKPERVPNKTYWRWLRWHAGEGEFKGKGPRSRPRPGDLPEWLPKEQQQAAQRFFGRRLR